MKKLLLLSLLVVSGCLPKYSQSITANTQDNSLVSLPKGKYAHRATEGSGMEVPIDTVTALDTLIQRLIGKFTFVNTGKGYFIGYTDDEFSIAAHGDAAIPALMRFIKSGVDPLGRSGAVYALHLIGINSTVAGRFYEEFKSVKAREALRELLKTEELQDEVMELLKRDPWQSDVPYLFDLLNHSNTDNWAIINCLTRYNIRGIPFHEEIPEEIADIRLEPLLSTDIPSNPVYNDKWIRPYEKQALELVMYLTKIENRFISVDTTLLHSRVFGNSYFSLKPGTWSVNGKKDKPGTITLGRLFNNLTDIDYSGHNMTRIQYYIENDRIHICSTVTVKQRLLRWWNDLPLEQKNSYAQNVGPRE